MSTLAVHLYIAMGVDEHLFMHWQKGRNRSFTKKGPGRKHRQG
jgi:hypothetical protein